MGVRKSLLPWFCVLMPGEGAQGDWKSGNQSEAEAGT